MTSDVATCLRRARARLEYLVKGEGEILSQQLRMLGINQQDKEHSVYLLKLQERHRVNIQSALEDYSRGLDTAVQSMGDNELSDEVIEALGI